MKTLYIHQIYGLFKDKKNMPKLFQDSYVKYNLQKVLDDRIEKKRFFTDFEINNLLS